MFISMGNMFGVPFLQFFSEPEYALLFVIVQMILTLPVLILNYGFFFRGFRALFHLSPNMDTLIAIGLAVLVILIGIRIVLSPLFKRARRRRIHRKVQEAISDSGIVFTEAYGVGGNDSTYAVKFGERTIRPDGDEFTSATLLVSFGEMKFDLTDARINDCAVIDANCSFGELSIILPDGVRADVTRGGAFSEITNHHRQPKDENAPVVYINATCSFGEIVVK